MKIFGFQIFRTFKKHLTIVSIAYSQAELHVFKVDVQIRLGLSLMCWHNLENNWQSF